MARRTSLSNWPRRRRIHRDRPPRSTPSGITARLISRTSRTRPEEDREDPSFGVGSARLLDARNSRPFVTSMGDPLEPVHIVGPYDLDHLRQGHDDFASPSVAEHQLRAIETAHEQNRDLGLEIRVSSGCRSRDDGAPISRSSCLRVWAVCGWSELRCDLRRRSARCSRSVNGRLSVLMALCEDRRDAPLGWQCLLE